MTRSKSRRTPLGKDVDDNLKRSLDTVGDSYDGDKST